MKVTLLGSGTSSGVPEVGCNCEVCRSTNPLDKRLRACVLVEVDGLRILLDCGPDFRQQMLQVPFGPIDAVLVSHEHYDHIGGLDDLRPFCTNSVIDIYGLEHTTNAIRQHMPYCFDAIDRPRVPHMRLHTIEPYKPFNIPPKNADGRVFSKEVMPFLIYHGEWPIMAYRIGKFAFITDMKTMPAQSYACLQGVELLFINGLRIKPHPTHQSISQAVEVAEQIGAKRVRLIHLAHTAGLHNESQALLPPHISFGYDGEVLEVE